MNSSDYPSDDQVLADLGEDFVHAFIDSVDGARDDFLKFRQWQPGWFPGFTDRFTANFLHERIWDRLVRVIESLDGIKITDEEPIRQVRSGTAYLIRVKRHRLGDRISAYPTKGNTAFWSNRELTFEGLESFNLALGYYWNAELRAVEEPVLSFRDGMDKPIWAVKLRREAGGATGFTWTPIEPDMPEADLSSVLDDTEEESGS